MAARECPICEIDWPAAEQYRTTFGSTAQRSVNDTCPVCGTTTRYALHRNPTPPDTVDEILEAIARDATQARFEAHYMERELAKFGRVLDTWPSAPA